MELEQFNHVWETFMSTIRGALMANAEAEPLTFERAQKLLASKSIVWQEDVSSEGIWLCNLKKKDKRKWEEVSDILSKNLRFFEEPTPGSYKSSKLIGAAGGGVLGYALAEAADMGTGGTIASTLIPLAAGFIGGNIYGNSKSRAALANTIEAYCNQLQSVYHSIVSILTA